MKYRGAVDLRHFHCDSVDRSSVVHRVCYDSRERYMLIDVAGTYYHYCDVPPETVTSLLASDSTGRYYNGSIKGLFDCRTGRVPAYE